MITYLIATSGRPTLANTLASIECWDGDEILVIGGQAPDDPRVRHIPCEPKGDWGHTERNIAMPYARGKYLIHIDDDDVYLPGIRTLLQEAIDEHPNGPSIFKMQYPDGRTLWAEQRVCLGNVGTPMTMTPNDPAKLGVWGPFHGGDFHYMSTIGWTAEELNWRHEIITLLGHA